MGNTLHADLPAISTRIYKEWYPKTVLVASCDNAFEGELDIDKLELDIPVYYDLSIHRSTIDEREVKPAPIEFVAGSTIRVRINKTRYTHWGKMKINDLVDKLTQEESATRAKLAERWAQEAEVELANAMANLPAAQTIDLTNSNVLTAGNGGTAGVLSKENLFIAIDVLKGHIRAANMGVGEFEFFTSERFNTIARDAQISFTSDPAAEAARKGYIGKLDHLTFLNHEVESVVTRNATSKVVTAEYAFLKTRDGVQYVIPYKDTVEYDITPDKVLLGGKAYQTVEMYDFFNLYPKRLYKVKIQYASGQLFPTVPAGDKFGKAIGGR